jgi:hypothetical protein
MTLTAHHLVLHCLLQVLQVDKLYQCGVVRRKNLSYQGRSGTGTVGVYAQHMLPTQTRATGTTHTDQGGTTPAPILTLQSMLLCRRLGGGKLQQMHRAWLLFWHNLQTLHSQPVSVPHDESVDGQQTTYL